MPSLDAQSALPKTKYKSINIPNRNKQFGVVPKGTELRNSNTIALMPRQNPQFAHAKHRGSRAAAGVSAGIIMVQG